MERIKGKIPKRRFEGFTDDWEQRKWSEVVDISTEMVDPRTGEFDELPHVAPGNIESFTGQLFDNVRLVKEENLVSGKFHFYNGDIIYGKINPQLGKYVFARFEGLTSADAYVLNSKNGIDQKYLFAVLQTKDFYDYSVSVSKRSGMPKINRNELNAYRFMAPSLEEQDKIGQVLLDLDHLITLHQRKLEKLKNIKKSYLSEMFPQEDEKKPKRRFKGFTDDWEQRKLEEWGTFYYGHSCPKWSVTADATTPCIRYGELYTKFGTKIDRVFSYTNIPTDKLRFSKGTEVLIPRVGEDPMDYNHCTWLSMPNVAIGEMISVFNTEQNPLFTATMFNATLQKEFAVRVEGGSVTNLYYEKLKNIDVSFPQKEEQEIIASFFEQIDNLITLHQRKLEKLKNIKQAYLNEMFV